MGDNDREVIAIVPSYWGRGRNKAEAKARLKKETSLHRKKVRYFDVSAGTVVNDMGNFVHYPPKGKTWDDFTKEQVNEMCTVRELK